MHADKDFIFATIYKDASGNVISEDHVRMDIAQWTFVGTGGEQMYAAAPLWKDARLAAAQDPSGPWQDPIDVNGQSSNSFFKSKLQGLPSSGQRADSGDLTDLHERQLYRQPSVQRP